MPIQHKSAYHATLRDWAKDFQEKHVSKEVQRLINQATFDLLYGPVADFAMADPADENADDWLNYPGFSAALDKIKKEVSSIPSQLYLDVDAGYWQETEPEAEKCESCDGEGTVGDDDHTHQQVRKDRCLDCDGRGCFDASRGWYLVERPELRKAIFGKELAGYI